MKARPHIVHILLIAVLGFVLYANSFGNQFVYDDDRLIVDNIHIKNLSYINKIFVEDIGEGAGHIYDFYRPLQIFTYMLDYALWGLSVFGYHLTNTLLHILAALSAYILCITLYKNERAGFVASLLFIVHPTHVEAVSYISGRADLLVALCIMLFFIFYIKYMDSGKAALFGGALICYIGAFLSKEYAIVLPALVLLYHYTFKKKVYVGAASILGCVTIIYIVLRTTVFKFTVSETFTAQPFLERLSGFFAALGQYAGILISPIDLHMEYGKRIFGATDPKVLFGLVIFAAALFCIYRARENKPVFFSLCWFWICLIPVSNLYPINAYMAEHWLYIPSVGIFAIAGYWADKALNIKGVRTIIIAAIVLVTIFFGYLTMRQNGFWKDSATFYERTLRYTNAARVYNNLGNTYADKGEHDKSISMYEKAIESDPEYTGAYSNLGNLYNKLGRFAEAAEIYKKAIAINPKFVDAYNNLGTAYDAMGNTDLAMQAYRDALKIRPDYSEAYSNIGNISYKAGDVGEAIKSYQKAVEINPYNAIAYYNLSKAYRKLGDDRSADDAYRRAKELNPQLP